MNPSTALELLRPVPVAQTVCAIIVTYYPDAQLLERVEKVLAQVPQVLIVDNGSPTAHFKQLNALAQHSKVHLIPNGRNEGLGAALNTGVRWAASHGFRWVVTLDQDTTIGPAMIDRLTALVHGYREPERLAVVGSNFRDRANGRLVCEPGNAATAGSYIEAMTVVTSGSLVSIDAFQSIGGFRDDFFIDCLDHEYCLRARASGFHVIISANPIMDHEIGHMTEHRFLWKKVRTLNHSPLRQYFTTRNSILLVRGYLGREPRWILGYLWNWFKSSVFMFLFEPQRFSKLSNIIHGFADGILGRTGPLRR
jgi:rhamnosyltransferase